MKPILRTSNRYENDIANVESIPTKIDLPYNFCLGPPTPGLGSRVGVGGLGLTKLTTGKEYYTFCII